MGTGTEMYCCLLFAGGYIIYYESEREMKKKRNAEENTNRMARRCNSGSREYVLVPPSVACLLLDNHSNMDVCNTEIRHLIHLVKKYWHKKIIPNVICDNSRK